MKLLTLLLMTVTAVVQAQLLFTTNNETITITGYIGNLTNLVIPGTTNGFPITAIAPFAFVSVSATNVTIADSVSFIGDGAFMDCESLTNLTLGNGISHIGDSAFEFCSSLTKLIIPTNVVSIGNWAFGECDGITCVTIPNSVTNIGTCAFARDNSLTNIFVADLNPEYASYSSALYDKAFTVLIQFPGGKGGCYSVPDGVTRIGEAAFNANAKINNVVIVNTVTNIGDTAFFNCTGLTNLVLGTGLLSIGENAFAYCNMPDVMIPNSVVNIDADAFDHCNSLADVTLGSSLISIAGAFNWCVNITNVTIPSTVRDISFAFVHCSSLTNVNLSEGITSIGAQAFWQCGNLKRIIIPDSVTNIGNATFSDSGLTSIFFEGNAPFVDMYAFFDDSTTAYYLSGSTGWGDFVSAAGISVQPWLPQAQIVQRYITVRTNLFGFKSASEKS